MKRGQNQMFNVSICDDSKYDIDKIKNALGMFSKRKHVELSISEFSNPEMLMYEIEDGKIADIFILDVEMPNMDGFELADKIREHTETSIIIFLTSHDEMASMGYKSKALRYVIKLNLERDIEEALDSAIAEISNVNDKTITLHHYNDYWRIAYKDIICVTRISRQLVITTRLLGDITDNRGIKEFFDMLSDNRFLFVDRSCFVNIDYISQIKGYSLKLTDGQILPISRRSLQNVKQTLLEQWGE
ncbi:MAG TPA: hypothetical protein DIU30_05135 [Clostridiales bacterium]|jgi:DNA-binding LytR/AlgR family response regulator|nr:hypothetical protein [Clostridiales bacterium]